jgi:HD-GYP domain-containing protein (c-di-GMP phosphodiesterase class II)
MILIAIVASSLLISQYYFSYQVAMNSTEKTFKLITNNILNQLKNENEKIEGILSINIDNKSLFKKINFQHNQLVLEHLIDMISMHKEFYSIYFAHKDGSFFEVINMDESELLYEFYGAPKQTAWTAITSINEKMQYLFFDKDIKILGKKFIKRTFNPLNRPWYKMAIDANETIITEPYEFANIQTSGITFARKMAQEGSVLAIDYTLRRLNNLLSLQAIQEDSEVFVFNTDGIKVSSSNINKELIDKALYEAFKEQKKSNLLRYEVDGKEYFTMYIPLQNENLFLAIKINATTLLKPYVTNLKYSFGIALILLFIFIPVVFIATNMIVKPIKELIKENNKIKDRKFDEVKNIQTNIIEFVELSDSLVSMSNNIQEYQKSQEELLDSIVKLIAEAIDTKSHYTGGHCERVPEIAQMLLLKASNSDEEHFKDFKIKNEDELREFEIGAWLHDCGKVITPEYVIDKATKLETINNRIHEIRTRFEVLWRDAQIDYLSAVIAGKDKEEAKEALHVEQNKLFEDFAFIASANIGGEFMDEDKKQRIKEIASKEWVRHFDERLGLGTAELMRYPKQETQLPCTEKLLSDKHHHLIKREFFDKESYIKDGFKEEVPEYLYNYGEVYNLCIEKGTLTAEERYKINEHVIMSIKMLEKIPFPARLSRVPEYAGTHHETLDAKGYPRKLSAKDLSIPSRIMAIADIFEALTASDRPYKKAKTLSESIKIMSFMVKDKHIDAELFKLFLKENLHVEYAKKYLKAEQIDEVDISKYL